MKFPRSVALVLPLVLLNFVVFGYKAEAANYTVKSSGGNYTTISACAAVAVAGDTCTVYASASPQSGWTQSRSGSGGNLITFIVNTGDMVTVTSQINLSGISYVRISGFNLTLNSAASYAVLGDGNTAHNQIDHNTAATTLFRIANGLGSNGSDNYLGYNTINLTGHKDNAEGFLVYGDRNLFEYNEIKNGEGDCFDLGGANVVVRNNNCHDINGASGEHIDFVQVEGDGTNPTLSYSLVENNVEHNCTNDGGNCHFIIIRTGSSLVADTVIARYNFAQQLDSQGPIDIGGVGDNVPNARFYNNTIAPESLYNGNGSCGAWQNASNGRSLNNICYNTAAATNSWSPFYDFSGGGLAENGNLVFTASYSGSWKSPYSAEATYPALHNQNPLFANYPTDDSLQSSSPAKGAGVPLTTVSSGDSGSGASVVVTDARFFQPGWGGAQADWIRVGASSVAQIQSINYSTNTLTLINAVARSVGDPIYLYKDSNGDLVLNGANPDCGGYIGPTSPPPQNLQANVQ